MGGGGYSVRKTNNLSFIAVNHSRDWRLIEFVLCFPSWVPSTLWAIVRGSLGFGGEVGEERCGKGPPSWPHHFPLLSSASVLRQKQSTGLQSR